MNHWSDANFNWNIQDSTRFNGYITEYSGFSSRFEISDRTPVGTLVGTVSATDAENDALTYSISSGNADIDGDGEFAFRIDETTGNIIVNDSGDLNFGIKSQFSLEITVSDGSLSSSTNIDIFLRNDAPVFPVDKPVLSVQERSLSGTNVGSVFATDAEGDALTYSIVGGNEDLDGDGIHAFGIDGATGAIFVNDSGDLNYNLKSKFTLEVSASDQFHSVIGSFDIDVLQAPHFQIILNPNVGYDQHHFNVPYNAPITDLMIDGSNWWESIVEINAYWQETPSYEQILNISDTGSGDTSYNRNINTLQISGQFSEVNIDLMNTHIGHLVDSSGWPEQANYTISLGPQGSIGNFSLSNGSDHILINGYDAAHAGDNNYYNWVEILDLGGGDNYLETWNTDIGYINSERGNDTIIIHNAPALVDENGDPVSGYGENGDAVNPFEWGTSTDSIDLGRGNNYVEIHNGGVETITSRRGDDVIKLFNAYADVVNFKSGNNTLEIYNNPNDFNTGIGTVQGYSGDDKVIGHGRIENLNLGGGNNSVDFSSGWIGYLDTNSGDDQIYLSNTNVMALAVESGDNYISIRNDEDKTDGWVGSIQAFNGNDIINIFNTGVDQINAGKGDNQIYFERRWVGSIQAFDGNDMINIIDGYVDQINAGSGLNTISIANNDINVTRGRGAGSITTYDGDDHIFVTSAHVDTIMAGSGRNDIHISGRGVGSIVTYEGDDFIDVNSAFVDSIHVGDGNNELHIDGGESQKGVGSIQALSGDDRIYAKSAKIESLNLGGGNNSIYIDINSPYEINGDVNASKSWIGSIVTYRGNDHIELGNTDVDQINAGNGDNYIKTGSGYVGTIQTYGGNDYIEIGSGGAKFVSTNGGSDTIKILQQSSQFNGLIVDGGYDSGTDIVDLSDWSRGITVQLGNNIAWQNPASANGSLLSQDGLGYLVLLGIEGIVGTAFNDVIYGSDIGSSRDNILIGGDGDDKLYGLAGDDRLQGGLGKDLLDGGVGNDTVDYSDRIDDLQIALYVSGDGRAYSKGASDYFTIEDTLKSIENIWSGAGNDNLLGNGQNNIFKLGFGNDWADGGLGNDTVDYSYEARSITAVLSGASWGNVKIDSEIDNIRNIENFIGGQANDKITGDMLANIIHGGQGSDIIDGGRGSVGGTDQLFGDDGNDLLISGLGNDILDGGTGIDTASYQKSLYAVTVDLAVSEAQNTVGAGTDQLISIENITGSNFDDVIKGNSDSNILSGSGGNDLLYGQGEDDILFGGAGDDLLDGGDGLDTASYEDFTFGLDLMNGSKLGVFIDLNLVGAQYNRGAGLDTFVSIENVTGSQFDDRIFGNYLDNVLKGGAGADILAGFNGNDILIGGSEGDYLSGGQGNDIFVFDLNLDLNLDLNNEKIDLIIDFEAGRDKIKLVSAPSISQQDIQSGDFFYQGDHATAQSENQKIIFDTADGTLYFDQDGSGDHFTQTAIAKISQTGHPSLNADDIIIA